MNHIDEIRIMEIALDEGAQKSTRESAHLEECETCAALLKSEVEFTASLMSMEAVPVPADFQVKTTSKYVNASSIRIALRPSIILGLVLSGLIASAMLWLVIANPAVFTSNAAMAFAKTVTFFKAMYLVFERVPYATEALTSTSGAMVLMSAALLSMLSKKAGAVK